MPLNFSKSAHFRFPSTPTLSACHSASLGESLVFYGADSLSNSLQDSLIAQLKARNPDWAKTGFALLGLVVTEAVKADINQNLCVPLKPLTRRYRSVPRRRS